MSAQSVPGLQASQTTQSYLILYGICILNKIPTIPLFPQSIIAIMLNMPNIAIMCRVHIGFPESALLLGEFSFFEFYQNLIAILFQIFVIFSFFFSFFSIYSRPSCLMLEGLPWWLCGLRRCH